MPATLPAYMSRLGLQPEPLQGPAQPLPDASLRRPELRVDIQPLTHLSTMHPSAVTTTPASALPDSPRVSMPSPASSTSSNSPRMTDVHASAVVPIARAHGAEERHQELYPPPALPRLIPEAHFRFPSQPVLADTTDATAAGLGSIPSEAKKPPAVRAASKLTKSSSLPSCSSSPSSTAQASSRAPLAHPYARIYARKAADPSAKRRKMWNHALEKSLFTPEEIATLGAPNRRAIYIASLEKHVDELHAQLIELGLYPVPFEALEPYTGLNSKTAKSMVAGLHKDDADMRTKLMELERATQTLHRSARTQASAGDSANAQHRRHSVTAAAYNYPNTFAGPSTSGQKPRIVMS